MFSNIYTYDSCRETCTYNTMYQKCNDTIDIWKQYNPAVKQSYDDNAKHASQEKCVKSFVDRISFGKFPKCNCRHACKESFYTATAKKTTEDSQWKLYLYVKGAVTHVELVPDYPLDAFMGSLGGVLGLSGKIMATLQLMIFLSLSIFQFCMR